jgi:hypothetical protein
MTPEVQLLSQFFPKELMIYFSIVRGEIFCSIEMRKEFFEINFEEKNIIPEGFITTDYESKGFMESKSIQDFPLRGKPVFLVVKSRRWRHKETRKEIKRDFSFIADSTKITSELSDFLKGGSRYAARFHEQYSQLLPYTT